MCVSYTNVFIFDMALQGRDQFHPPGTVFARLRWILRSACLACAWQIPAEVPEGSVRFRRVTVQILG